MSLQKRKDWEPESKSPAEKDIFGFKAVANEIAVVSHSHPGSEFLEWRHKNLSAQYFGQIMPTVVSTIPLLLPTELVTIYVDAES